MAIKSFYSKQNYSNAVIESMIVGKSDQRGFLRMGIESELTFQISGKNETYTGKTKDLSATGICFNTDQVVAEGDVLQISVKPGTDITPPLEAMLTVIRVTPGRNGGFDVAGEIRQQDA